MENKTPSDKYKWVQLVCMKVQAHRSLEPPLEYNQDQMPLTNKVYYDLYNDFGIYRSTMQFQISFRRESR